MEIGNYLNRLRRPAFVAVIAAAGLGAIACNGKNRVAAPCVSPRAVSAEYPGDPAADPVDQSTWRSGIEVMTSPLPDDAHGLIFGFRGAGGEWRDSQLVAAADARRIGVKIGHGAVQFSSRVQAPAGSAACEQPPQSAFGQPEPFDVIMARGATAPRWQTG
jgi:hypothetical protein